MMSPKLPEHCGCSSSIFYVSTTLWRLLHKASTTLFYSIRAFTGTRTLFCACLWSSSTGISTLPNLLRAFYRLISPVVYCLRLQLSIIPVLACSLRSHFACGLQQSSTAHQFLSPACSLPFRLPALSIAPSPAVHSPPLLAACSPHPALLYQAAACHKPLSNSFT